MCRDNAIEFGIPMMSILVLSVSSFNLLQRKTSWRESLVKGATSISCGQKTDLCVICVQVMIQVVTLDSIA